MAEKTVMCAKLKEELPALDEATPTGQQALKMAKLFGGDALQQRVRDQVSLQAWQMWTEHMLMVMNEFRLDPTSDASNAILAEQMEKFFFGDADHSSVPGYMPPEQQ